MPTAAAAFTFRPSASFKPAATTAAAAIDLTGAKGPALLAGKSPSKFKLKIEPGTKQRTMQLVAKPAIPTLTFAAPAASTLPEVPAAGRARRSGCRHTPARPARWRTQLAQKQSNSSAKKQEAQQSSRRATRQRAHLARGALAAVLADLAAATRLRARRGGARS